MNIKFKENQMERIRLILADDHAVVRAGIRELLERQSDLHIVGEAVDGEQAVILTQELQPDVVVMDVKMSKISGVEATRRIKAENPDVRVLVLTAHDDDDHVFALLRAGANGYLLKTAEIDELVKAIRTVAAGQPALAPSVAGKVVAQFVGGKSMPDVSTSTQDQYDGLTERELGILRLVSKGFSNKQIGKELFISDRTVQAHLSNIFSKLGVSSRTEAVMRAVHCGWITADRNTESIPPRGKITASDLSETSSFHNPYIAGPPITDPNMFFGREQILQQIINTLHNNHIMITGPRRIGKTTLLHQLKNRLTTLNDPDYSFIPIIVDVQGTPEWDFFHTAMDEIVTALSEYLPRQAIPALDFDPSDPKYNSRVFGKDLDKIIKALPQSSPGKTVKMILLMDEMDVMNSYDQRVQSQLRSIFQKPFARNLSAVVAGTDLRQQWKLPESPFYNMFVPLALEPFSLEEARQLILKPVAGIYHYDDEAVTKILEVTGRHPFRLQQLCREIIQRVAEEKRKHITLADVETTLDTIQWIEEESNQVAKKDFTQQESSATAVLAEKPATYNSSTLSQKEEKSE